MLGGDISIRKQLRPGFFHQPIDSPLFFIKYPDTGKEKIV
jgi:hypothetical protein